MEKALENLSRMEAAKKIAIVGDMFELGDETKTEHARVGKLLSELEIQEAFFCGNFMEAAYKTFGSGHYMKTKDELIAHLKENKFTDATILIKASRGMALEDLVDYIY
jgi:UDP-N-acetylmuramoyl-tripeptide--D-alanyl-D-alanine ligase